MRHDEYKSVEHSDVMYLQCQQISQEVQEVAGEYWINK